MNFRANISERKAMPAAAVYRQDGVFIEAIHDLTELESRNNEWNALALKAPQHLPMTTCTWVKTYFECCLSPTENWLVLFAYENNRMIGVLPLVVKGVRVLGISRIVLATPFDWNTASVDLISDGQNHERVVNLMVNALTHFIPGWHRLDLKRIPETSLTADVMAKGVRNASVISEFNGFGLLKKFDDSLDEYMTHFSSDFRRKIKKGQKKMSTLPEARISRIIRPALTAEELSSFFKLEASGWKGQKGSAILNSPELLKFYNLLFQRLPEIGEGELYLLESGQDVVAGNLSIRLGPYCISLKIAYDERFADYSPGNYLLLNIFKEIYSSKNTDELDCLNDTEWHRRWRLTPRKYYNFYLSPRTLFPVLTDRIPRKIISSIRRNKQIRKIFGKAQVPR